MEQSANFKQDLAQGQQAEQLFLTRYQSKFNLTRTDGKSGDFLSNGMKLELKSDSYKFSEKGNLFIETVRNTSTGKPGGVIQAVKEHNCEIYAYWFPGENYYFLFDAEKLMNALPTLTENERPVIVENESYYTKGYLIKAYRLLPFCIETNAPLKLVDSFKPVKKTPFSMYMNVMKRA